jgi:hypothetical protein
MIGMDDHDLASVVDLTTVAQPVREQAPWPRGCCWICSTARSRVTST